MECFIADFSGERAGILSAFPRFLDPGEIARLESMGSPKRRLEFAAGRVLLKSVCSRVLGIPAARVAIEVLPGGAISIKGRPDIYVSLAHSGNFAACAVSETPCGIDIELMKRRDYSRVLDWLAPGERAGFAKLSEDAQLERFYGLWTVREARHKLLSVAPSQKRVHVSTEIFGDYMLAAACFSRPDPTLVPVEFKDIL